MQRKGDMLPLTSAPNKSKYEIFHAHDPYRYGQSLVQFDGPAERRLRWKIDLHVVPVVALLYLFCFIDRTNIGEHPPAPARFSHTEHKAHTSCQAMPDWQVSSEI